MSWTPHIDSLCKKLNTSMFMIKQIKSLSNTKTARTAYFSFFESQLRYGLAVWSGTSATNLKRILIIQKKAVRVLADLQHMESCRDAFINLKIMTVVSLYILEVVLHVDGEYLPRNRDIHSHNTRNGALYNLPAHHMKLFESKPSYIGRKFFNRLPQELQHKRSSLLKAALKKWLLDRPFYSLEEFLQGTFQN
uniref:Uncharacterized protein n=1 Tax=Homalodisca liturata TaxID=320908 RepID=A0A1B6HVU0_9HEMI